MSHAAPIAFELRQQLERLARQRIYAERKAKHDRIADLKGWTK